ncbi:MAG: electron transfer flavoprotein subunit alpha/FixB family protein [candidate division Zixibacteria bacterium]|jgi:electron transfer flavoprotein alpha subunit|nr:electron transfer flavoprotein subunit alpha/FixB family protein [candidate division Zixibacteria bacterium]
MKILAIALQKNGSLLSADFEVLEAAKSLGGELHTAILAEQAESLAAELAKRGGGKVLAVSNPALKFFHDEIYAKVIGELVTKHGIDLALCPATTYGKALTARLAGANGGRAASDVTAVKVESGKLTVTRPTFGGNVITTLQTDSGPFFVSIRPKIFNESKDGSGNVVVESVSAAAFEGKAVIRDVRVEAAATQNLAEADVIVSAGRGIKGPENVKLIQDLAAALNGAFGASRAIVDAGWVEYKHQVGQTGRTVNPKLYIACGISGAIQHLVGMQTSRTIVAVNKDKDAPIFNIATYGIVGDLFEIVPAMTKKFKAELGA